MSLKENFENHPVVWGLTLIVVGAGSGFAFNEMLANKSKPTASASPVSTSQVICTVDGLDKLTEGHHIRVAVLQETLIGLEKKASDNTIIGSDQADYRESADRVRQDIDVENGMYKENIAALEKKCK